MQYRQGDILIITCEDIPAAARPRKDLVVATGEATGHAHRLTDANSVRLYDAANGDIFAEVISDVSLVHEEHAAITITPGIYRIRRQREYTPADIKQVED